MLEEGWNAHPSSPVLAQGVLRVLATCSRAEPARLDEALAIADRLARQQPSIAHLETVAMLVAATGRYDAAVDVQTQAIFEAVKQGNEDQLPWMRENLRRYESGQPAAAPRSGPDPEPARAQSRTSRPVRIDSYAAWINSMIRTCSTGGSTEAKPRTLRKKWSSCRRCALMYRFRLPGGGLCSGVT